MELPHRGALSDAHGSQQMTQYLAGVQAAVNNWGGALPVDPDHPERRQLAFPLAHLHGVGRIVTRGAAVRLAEPMARGSLVPVGPASEIRAPQSSLPDDPLDTARARERR
ncbi:hypothetical protein [Streptomyces sp. NPDC055287]